MILAEIERTQLWMVGGLLMLGWVLARRQISLGKRGNRNAHEAKLELKALREWKDPAVPLNDAPVETQRWQIAMFDLQRELTAELDSRISVIQTLIRQLDNRIDSLGTVDPKGNPCLDQTILSHRIAALSHSGLTAKEISEQLSVPVGDVELLLTLPGYDGSPQEHSAPGRPLRSAD